MMDKTQLRNLALILGIIASTFAILDYLQRRKIRSEAIAQGREIVIL